VTSPALQGLSAAVATACGVAEPRQPSGAVDWSAFLRLVDRHNVAPLVERSGWLAQAGAPPDVRSAVAERARAHALESLRLLALHRDVLAVLASAGVDAVVLKGAVLAVDAYGDPSARATGDIDLLVDPESVPRAVRALRSAGLDWVGWPEPDDPDRPSVEPAAIERLSHLPMLGDVALAGPGCQVELHWRLFPNARLMPVDPGWLSAPRRMDVQGIDIPTLPLAACWLYTHVHGSDHEWALMKWLADVPALALRQPELAEHAALWSVDDGYRRSVATGLLVAEAVFGPFLTPESRAWASTVQGTRILVSRSLSSLTSDDYLPSRIPPAAVAGLVAGRLALRPDARYRLEELRLLLLSAGRAQAVEDPGLADLAAGPLHWTRRATRRLAGRRSSRR
jgi:putative nucleotidyltransferase-like protein